MPTPPLPSPHLLVLHTEETEASPPPPRAQESGAQHLQPLRRQTPENGAPARPGLEGEAVPAPAGNPIPLRSKGPAKRLVGQQLSLERGAGGADRAGARTGARGPLSVGSGQM